MLIEKGLWVITILIVLEEKEGPAKETETAWPGRQERNQERGVRKLSEDEVRQQCQVSVLCQVEGAPRMTTGRSGPGGLMRAKR